LEIWSCSGAEVDFDAEVPLFTAYSNPSIRVWSNIIHPTFQHRDNDGGMWMFVLCFLLIVYSLTLLKSSRYLEMSKITFLSLVYQIDVGHSVQGIAGATFKD
jgi:hypothetical protein